MPHFRAAIRFAALLLCISSMPASAAYTSLTWDSTDGAGIAGGSDIQASPGDELELGLYLTLEAGESLLLSGVSLEFDHDLKNELDILSITELDHTPSFSCSPLPECFTDFGPELINITPGVEDYMDSGATSVGRISTFEMGNISDAVFFPRTIKLGTVTFAVTANVETDGEDVFAGEFNVGFDGFFQGNSSPLPVSSQGSAGVDALAGGSDSDGDGVPDAVDVCPGGNDNIDSDADGVPDFCDVCLGGDDAADADLDGVPNACDVCSGGDDAADADLDGVPNACDVCPGGDDTIDSDADGVPDSCDACVGDDATGDPDADGVCTDVDPCPADNPDDTDADGVCDSADVCPGFDDGLDADVDGTPDGCDVCPLDSDDDADADGVCGDVDICPLGDDNLDADSDGIPDACDDCHDCPDVFETELDRATVWRTRSKLGRIRADGTLRVEGGTFDQTNVEITITDGQDLAESGTFTSCQEFASGTVRCQNDDRTSRIRYIPDSTDATLYRFKLDYRRRDIEEPQVAPARIEFLYDGSLSTTAANEPCRVFTNRLACKGNSVP